MGFGASRTEARQVVRHNGILVNGKRVNIPSYQVSPGDVVEVASKAKEQLRIKAAAEAAESRGIPEWLQVDSKGLKGTFKAMPGRADLPSTINESLMFGPVCFLRVQLDDEAFVDRGRQIVAAGHGLERALQPLRIDVQPPGHAAGLRR